MPVRDLILKSLQQEKHISGEEIGKRLKISRTAVWKHIKELRRLGYEIESSPKSGYSFVKRTNLLLPAEIALGLNTQIMGKRVVHYCVVTSTQDVTIEIARDGAPEGTLVVAERQTRGRGRQGRRWVSPEDGIYLSLILRPTLLPSKVVQIPLIAGIALAKAIREAVPIQPMIKWPNDIVIDQRKVGGILTEMSSEIDKVNYVVLGIGLNVNTPASLLAKETDGIVTSIIDKSGAYTSRVKLVQIFLSQFDLIYAKFLAFGFSSVSDEWKMLNNTIGSWIKVSDCEREIEGEVLDIDNDGFLLVRKQSGDISRIVSGDVSYSDRIV